MIRHIVFFKFADDRATTASEAKRRLNAMADKVEQVRSLEAGVNVVESDRAYDLALTVTFDSLADLGAYATHPEHEVFAEWVRERAESIVACDYEI